MTRRFAANQCSEILTSKHEQHRGLQFSQTSKQVPAHCVLEQPTWNPSQLCIYHPSRPPLLGFPMPPHQLGVHLLLRDDHPLASPSALRLGDEMALHAQSILKVSSVYRRHDARERSSGIFFIYQSPSTLALYVYFRATDIISKNSCNQL